MSITNALVSAAHTGSSACLDAPVARRGGTPLLRYPADVRHLARTPTQSAWLGAPRVAWCAVYLADSAHGISGCMAQRACCLSAHSLVDTSDMFHKRRGLGLHASFCSEHAGQCVDSCASRASLAPTREAKDTSTIRTNFVLVHGRPKSRVPL